MRPDVERLPVAVLPALVLVLLVAGLEGLKAAGVLPVTVPAPSAVAEALAVQREALLSHLVPTLRTALAGYAIAALLALGLGLLASVARRSEHAVLRAGLALDSIPLIALSPILMLWLGNGTVSHVLIAVLACQFPLVVGAVQGFKAAERNALELFHVLAASPWQRWRFLVLPTALPYLFAALKVAAPLAVLGALIAEWVNAERGLGIMMVYALFSFDAAQVWLTILAVCALALGGYGAVALLERLVVTWESGGRLEGTSP